jgi:hypothetical protein
MTTDTLEQLLDQLPEEVDNSNWLHDTFTLHIASGLSEIRSADLQIETGAFYPSVLPLSVFLRQTIVLHE